MADADLTLDGGTAIIDGDFLEVQCTDIKLDAAARRGSATGERRALVHGFNDELVINFNNDYPGGVTLSGEIGLPGKIKQDHVRLEATDLHLNHPARRSTPGGERRALVHGFNDELVLNWAKDYPGGTVTHGDLEVQKGKLRIRNNSGNVVTELNTGGDAFLGGNGTAGALVLKDGNNVQRVRLSASGRSLDFRDGSGVTVVSLDADHFTGTPWPAWDGEAVQTQLQLITELRRMKQEILELQAQVAALTGP